MNHLLTRATFLRNVTRYSLYINRSHISGPKPPASIIRRNFASKTSSSSTNDPEIVDPDKPYEYLGSRAAKWRAEDSTAGGHDDAPWQEMWSILASVTVFLIYFCVLREENDIDEKLVVPLYDRVPGLEQQNLIVCHKYNIENRIDNKAIEARMKELGMDVEEIRKKHLQ